MASFIPKALLVKQPFMLFGPKHLMTMTVITLLIIMVISLTKKINNTNTTRKIAYGIAALSSFSFLIGAYLRFEYLHKPFLELLPLAYCNVISLFLIPWILIKRKQTIFETCYYLGLGGTTQAIITPSLHFSTPFICSIAYYAEHSAILLGVIYCLVVYRMSPQKGSVVKTWVTINLYYFTIMGINYLLGTNFCYTWHKPHGTNLFSSLSPWPWYIPEVSFIALIIITCLYLPFYLARLNKQQFLKRFFNRGLT